ncbi:unnamed protein product [Diabrotica balteata]|uniref:Uncharacterized protein n=1 Tax=Diabrotica balteata TaxID=107213 RepID=A0A9N9XDJ1_DIABA|nr:unnamed protein product [Diabrotica balteata]
MAVAGKDGDNGAVEFQFYQPDNRTKWETFRQAIYDKSSNQFLGRTPKNWGQLLFFYSIFYIVLAALFAICMQGLFATLDDRVPKWRLDRSLIGVNPGLGFRPISNVTEEGSLIWYNITNHTTINKWVGLIDTFLLPYKANQTGKNFVPCNKDKRPGSKEVCETSITNFKNCSPGRMYGYNTSTPCVFLKLNRIFGWVPEFITSPQEGMPKDLADHIQMLKDANSTERMIWVTCNGVDDFDRENIKGFNYYPKGFSSSYYPYTNIKNYLSPIVAVEVVNITPNVLVSIECRAWAENIKYSNSSLNRAGSVRFEIQVDREPESSRPILQNQPKAASIVDAKTAVPVGTDTTMSPTSDISTSAIVNATTVLTTVTA